MATAEDQAVRELYGVTSIRVRGKLVHPECRTAAERRCAAQFFKDKDGTCEVCNRTIAEGPPPR